MVCKLYYMVVASLVLIVMAQTAAFADTDTEIMFRGIEWGTSIDCIEPEIDAHDYYFTFAKNYIPYWGTAGQQLDYTFDRISNNEIGWMGVAIGDGEIMVGGYGATAIDIYCAFGLDDNGNLLRNAQDSMFYYATYAIETSNVNAAYSDLKEKLSSLYGECVEFSDEAHGGMAVEKIAQWKGANNTAVRLYGQMRSTEEKAGNFFEYIEIYYGKTDFDEHLRNVESAVEREKLAAEAALYGNNDTSGL